MSDKVEGNTEVEYTHTATCGEWMVENEEEDVWIFENKNPTKCLGSLDSVKNLHAALGLFIELAEAEGAAK